MSSEIVKLRLDSPIDRAFVRRVIKRLKSKDIKQLNARVVCIVVITEFIITYQIKEEKNEKS